MEAKELRIGNWVSLSGEIPCSIICIDGETFYAKDYDGIWLKNTTSELHPIPLTPEILEKAGFTRHHGYFTINDIASFSYKEQEGRKTWVSVDNPIKNIDYIHQLQNLYFAITGQELDIQL